MTTLLRLHLLLTLFPSCTCVYLLSCRPYSQFKVEDVFGNLACIDCPRCLRGYGLSPKCGGYVKYGTKIGCKPCTLGVTYSATHDIDSCQPCKICSDHQKVIRNCTLESNSKCNHSCSTGFYYEDMTGDCQACSFCCSDGRNTVKDQCKDMPFYKQCDANEISCQPKCQDDQYLVVRRTGEPHCQNCKDCPAGSSLSPQCGSIVENTDDIKCVECIAGKTFSGKTGKQACKTCTECSIGQKEVRPCNLTHDRMCGKCNKGFYNVTGTECKPCSACCGDDNDVRIPDCIKQNMPKNKQCSFTQRAINECQQGKSTGLIIAVVMAPIGVIAAIGILVLCKNSKNRKYPCIKQPIARSQSLPVLLLSSEEEPLSHSIILEDPIAHGAEESLNFEKSGASIQFSDGENFYCDAQGVGNYSKLLSSLLNHEEDLEEISVRLDTAKTGAGDYRVVAQHYGLDHYKISSILEKHAKGPSTALIDSLAASKPELTVQEFAAVVEEKAKRKDVVKVLLAYDSNNK